MIPFLLQSVSNMRMEVSTTVKPVRDVDMGRVPTILRMVTYMRGHGYLTFLVVMGFIDFN